MSDFSNFTSAPSPAPPVENLAPSFESEDAPDECVEVCPSAEEINAPPESVDGTVMPREWSARYRHWTPEQKSEWRAIRNRCRVDPIYCSAVLGMDLVETPHLVLFQDLLRFRGEEKDGRWVPAPFDTLSVKHKKMMLASRGVCKTTSIRVVMVQAILNYVDIRICFLTGSDALGKLQLAAIKNHFENPSPEFLRLFPEYCLKSKQNKASGNWHDVGAILGNSQKFSVPCRSTSVFAEPTFKISTAKSVKSGSHFTLMVCDDLVNDTNYQNAGALEKCYQSYTQTIPLLEPTGILLMTGTRYSFGDTYERIMEAAKNAGDLSNWSISVRDCWSRGICTCSHADCFHDRSAETGNVVEPPCMHQGCECKGFVCSAALTAAKPNSDCLFPQITKSNGEKFGHTKQFLLQLQAEDSNTFSHQYLNVVISQFEQQFTETMIGAQTIFDAAQMPPRWAPTFIVGDPAFTAGNESRDETCLWVFSVWLGAYWIRDCAAGRWGSSELCATILKLIRRYAPNTIYLEGGMAQDSIQNLLVARSHDFGVYRLPIVWMTPSNKRDAKLLRIGAAASWIQGRRVWLYHHFPSDVEGYSKLVKQLVRFPRGGGHDDRADAFGRIFETPIALDVASQSTREQQQIEATRKSRFPYLGSNEGPDENAPYPDAGAGSGIVC